MKTVHIVEDDAYLARSMADEIADLDCKCVTFADCRKFLAHRGPAPAFVMVDLFVPKGSGGKFPRGLVPTRHAGNGILLLREARKKWPNARLILMTGMPSADAQEWCLQNQVRYALKPLSRDALERILGVRRLRGFVVHGRNASACRKAVSALKQAGIDAVVLMKQPNRGQSVIEKFERVADTCDCAVVVWSPDDFGRLAVSRPKAIGSNRVRQNVLFELGYFYGALRRRSGRVVILEFGATEIPSDLAGILRIDSTRATAEVSAELQHEIRHLLE